MREIIPQDIIEKKIHIIRGQKVILDKDLAVLYGVKPIRLREQVKRNIKRFPEDFMFQLVEKEIDFMVSQNAIPSRRHLGGHRPYAFTENGVAMLSGILNSDIAIDVNIQIMRTFTRLRMLMATHKDLKRKIEQMEKKYDSQFQVVFEAIKQLLKSPENKKRQIGFKRN